ncbi:GNAT family N-acetyltransferase [Paenibacillus sp. J22TS3]|uniref:GNAT family N-acetyltransferase n=1 Tax=Paenibacillus sp. J22TS3 TaxID=2807192 RepID=UPI001B1F7F54|nr:GNAT family N-acetyltransferase [Paenibacillus sp. J22TS3]GIP24070.1 hypothetical protein J22TS3_43450 [Paenibacillus sp. J22TS3]
MLSKDQLRSGYPVIETKRLILRGILPKDEMDLYSLITDPAVYPHLGIHTSTALFPSRLYRHFEEANRTLSALHFVITRQGDDTVMGLCSLQRWDEKKGTAMIGYCVSPSCWNTGIATEAVKAMVDFGLNELGLRQIRGRCEEDNHASRKVMLKCGLVRDPHDSAESVYTRQLPGLITFVLEADL